MARQVFRSYQRLTTATFPIAYQFANLADRTADVVVISPGRIFDRSVATPSINYEVGFRVFAGMVCNQEGWNQANYKERSGMADWTAVGDQEAFIPWLGRDLILCIEFYRVGTVDGPLINLEFAIVAYNESSNNAPGQQQDIRGHAGPIKRGVVIS